MLRESNKYKKTVFTQLTKKKKHFTTFLYNYTRLSYRNAFLNKNLFNLSVIICLNTRSMI